MGIYEDRTEEVYPPSVAPFLPCPALRGCLFAFRSTHNQKAGPMKKILTLVALLCLHTPTVAAELYAKPEPPAQLVEAIALQESGLNPFAVNIAGRSYSPATREKAEQLIQRAIAAGLPLS